MKTTNHTFIVWDLGGTKCAASVVHYDAATQDFSCRKRCTIKLHDTTSLADMTQQIETALEVSMREVDAICIGGAGQYDGKELCLASGYPYPMPFAALAAEQQWAPFAIVHDYTPIVCATFTSYLSHPDYVKRLNTREIEPYGRRIALGIGTGLGLKDGILLPDGDFWLGKNEIGHMGVPTPPAAQAKHLQQHQEFMRFLADLNDHPVTFERILSGPGMLNLYHFLYPTQPVHTPEEVGEAILRHQSDELLRMFAWYLGLLVGTVQLAFMPEGGIWMTGGVALHHMAAFDLPEFRDGIHASPAYQTERERYPLGVLQHTDHAFIGGSYYALKKLI